MVVGIAGWWLASAVEKSKTLKLKINVKQKGYFLLKKKIYKRMRKKKI